MIIPAYNVEKYLKRCIESVLAQELPPARIIITDDGSTDATGEICDRYAKEHPQITVLHQINAGVSAARNAAMKKADCRYFVFLDADDALEAHALKTLLEAQEKEPGSFIAAGRVTVRRNGEGGEICSPDPVSSDHPESMDGRTARMSLCSGRYGLQSACHKLFETSRAQGLSFETGIDNGEDRLFVYGYLTRCERVSYLPAGLWKVYAREESASRRPPDRRWLGMIRVMDRLIQEEPEEEIRRKYRLDRMELLVLYISAYLWRGSRDREFYRELRIGTRQGLRQYRADGASHHDLAAARLFGYAPTGLLRLYLRIRGKEI